MKKIILLALVLLGSTIVAGATPTKEESKWVEIQEVEIPLGLEIHEGITKNGNPKYWFVFDEIGKVSISEGNVKHYTNQTKIIVLVKWEKDGKYKYTTRQKKSTKKSTPNVNLNNLFSR